MSASPTELKLLENRDRVCLSFSYILPARSTEWALNVAPGKNQRVVLLSPSLNFPEDSPAWLHIRHTATNLLLEVGDSLTDIHLGRMEAKRQVFIQLFQEGASKCFRIT